MAQELLVEIGTEEIPAGYIEPALSHLRQGSERKLAELNLGHGDIRTFATPRRLCLLVENLTEKQDDQRLEVMGPPKKAAFDADNKPTKAALGFAASRGATVDDLQVVETAKGEYLMVVQEIEGRPSQELLQELLPELILSIPFPKSMRWADHKIHFARPIQWLVALYGGKVIPFSLAGLHSGATTRGHRFTAPQETAVTDFHNYQQVLAKQDVEIDIDRRRQMISQAVQQAAQQSGGQVVLDEQLLDTVTNLVEIPQAVCGSFAEKFLALPPEVLTTSMRVNQKYFTVAAEDGSLLPYFVAVNNTRVKDMAISRQGHERVLRARLEDALFFYQEDRKKSLADNIPALEGVIFQAELGTMAEKSSRIALLAEHLASQIAADERATVKRAARLCKADLVSEMVGEFASLQGIMGKYYASHDGESAEVAQAIADHYLPLRAGSALPESRAGALLSLADRFDTICGCFAVGKRPTGATDPYGLRRHALAIIHIIEERQWPLSLSETIDLALKNYGEKIAPAPETARDILTFLLRRYCNDKTGHGANPATVEAATSVLFDDISDCNRRLVALAEMADNPDFTLLAGSFKRVSNIIKDHGESTIDPALLKEPAEQALADRFNKVNGACQPLLAEKKYGQALREILGLKDAIDTFFNDVMVMDKEERIKNNRLSLLTAIARLFLQIGDFSKMYTLTR